VSRQFPPLAGSREAATPLHKDGDLRYTEVVPCPRIGGATRSKNPDRIHDRITPEFLIPGCRHPLKERLP